MANVALVSVTLNAVNPMTAYLQKHAPDWKVRNYLDSHLMEKIRQEGGIRDESMRRMYGMLSNACEDGADAVLLTCTAFSGYAEHFAALLSKPIICPDRAMLEQVAAQDGKIGILCTFTGTVENTRNLFYACRRALGREETVDMIVLPEAYAAAGAGDLNTHDRIIADKLTELDSEYDHLVLAQISMARAKDLVKTQHATVYSSPDSAYQAVKAAL